MASKGVVVWLLSRSSKFERLDDGLVGAKDDTTVLWGTAAMMFDSIDSGFVGLLAKCP